MANTGPSATITSSRSVTTVAISMIVSDSGFRPVISRSIQIRWSALGMLLAKRLPARERMRQRAAVDVLELPAHRHAVSDAAGAHAAPRGELAEVVGGGLPLDRRVGGEDELAHAPLGQNALELAHTELLRPDAIERRQVPHEHEVATAVAARGLDRHHVGGGLDRTEHRAIALRCGADGAQLPFGQHAAAPAARHRLQRRVE